MEDYSKYKGHRRYSKSQDYRGYSEPKNLRDEKFIEIRIGKDPVRFFLTLEAVKICLTVFFMIVFLSLWAYAFFGMANQFSAAEAEFRRPPHSR